MSDVDVELAVLKNNYKHLLDKQMQQDERLNQLIAAVEANNEIISKSRGMVLGAAIVVNVFWIVGLSVWGYFRP